MTLAVPLAERAETLVALGYDELEGRAEHAPEVAVQATLEALARGETHYTDRPGILPLREAVSAMLARRFDIETDPRANTVITCGVTEARFVAVQQLLGPGDALYAGAHAKRVAGPLTVRGSQLTEEVEKARALYLTSAMAKGAQRELLEKLPEDGLVIFEIEDEASAFHPAQLKSLSVRTVTIGDLGTARGLLSWRIGFLAAPPSSAAGLRDFKQALTICTTNLSQWAALAVMEG